MNILGPRIHGILDYVIVVFFLLVPTLFTLPNGLTTLAYVLAILHLTMTVLTDFPLGMLEVIPFGLHGIVELVAAIALIALPWIMSDLFLGGRTLFSVTGVVLFLIWLLTSYRTESASTKTSESAA